MQADAPRASWRDLLLLALVAVALLAPGVSSLPPVDRDEPRYAVATTQMLASGDLIDIRYQEAPRYLQPAGVYWLQTIPTALFSTPGHRDIWTFRLPSLFGAVLAVLVTGWAASRRFGRRVGLTAAVLLASCVSLGFEARIAKTDAALLAAVVVAQFALMRAYLDPLAPRRTAVAFWAALGCGVLLKGPIILLVSGLTVLALAAWDRRAGWLARLRPAWGAPLALLIAAPWYVAIGLKSHGEFFRIAIGKSLMGKVAAGQQAHGSPPGYHLALFPLTFWPASLLAPLALPMVWRDRREGAVRFLIAWIAPSWIVFELVKTKLPHYVLPTFPAIACLTALALWAPRPAVRTWARGLFVAFALLWAVLSVGLAAVGPWALWTYARQVDPTASGLAVVALAGLAGMAWSLWRRRPELTTAAAAIAALATAVNIYVVSAPRLQTFWLSPRIERAVEAARRCPQDQLVSTPYHEPSLVFLHGPAATTLADSPQAAAVALSRARACGLALVGAQQQPAFLAAATALGLRPRPRQVLEGRDYAYGKAMALTLYDTGPVASTPAAAP